MTTRRNLFIAARVIGLPVIGLAFYVWTIALEAVEAEATLHAVIFSRDLLYNYTKNNPCKWPSSWEVLKTVKQSPSAFYTWPDDMDEIKKRVRIDFAASYCDVLNKDTEFKPIAPIGPCYSHKQYLFPLDSMPVGFQLVAHLVPATWLIDAARGIILRGADWSALWKHALALWTMAIAVMTLSALKLR